jgi:hypothetical protein
MDYKQTGRGREGARPNKEAARKALGWGLAAAASVAWHAAALAAPAATLVLTLAAALAFGAIEGMKGGAL